MKKLITFSELSKNILKEIAKTPKSDIPVFTLPKKPKKSNDVFLYSDF